MSAADATVFEAEFQSTVQTIIWLPLLELVQLFAQEIFYYTNPVAGHARMAWAWGVFWIGLAISAVVAGVSAILFVACKTERKWRMRLLLICFLVPIMILQVAIQETYYYAYPGDYPQRDRLLALGLSVALLYPLTWLFCWAFCEWCDCAWKGLGQFFYARLPVTDQV